MISQIGKLGIGGFVVLVVIGTVAFVAIYGYIERPDHELTSSAFEVVKVGAGGVIAGIGGWIAKTFSGPSTS